MSSFLSGALGAIIILFAAGVVRAAAFRRWRRRGPAHAARLLRRIGATPDQEHAVRAELDALSEAFLALRADARPLRGDLADLIVAPTLDAARVGETLDARLASAAALRTPPQRCGSPRARPRRSRLPSVETRPGHAGDASIASRR